MDTETTLWFLVFGFTAAIVGTYWLFHSDRSNPPTLFEKAVATTWLLARRVTSNVRPHMNNPDRPLTCLMCPEPIALVKDSSVESEIEFFECPECHRRYAKAPGEPLTFRWLHPISIALYGFAFRSGPRARHVAMAVMSLTKDYTPEQVSLTIRELELELENPTQPVHLILPGIERTEEECRSFLLSILNELKSKGNA